MTGYCLADCNEAPAKAMPCKKNKKEEIPMSAYSSATVITADSIEAKQRKTLASALYDAFRDKVTAAKKQFGLMADSSPETVKEFIQRIKDGKYTLTQDAEDAYASGFWYSISWKDPSVSVDKDGYKAAREQLDKDYKALELRIAVLPIADALTAVETYRDAK